jgi:hypothetical protein
MPASIELAGAIIASPLPHDHWMTQPFTTAVNLILMSVPKSCCG